MSCDRENFDTVALTLAIASLPPLRDGVAPNSVERVDEVVEWFCAIRQKLATVGQKDATLRQQST
jgi:hypothetical protein